MVLPIPKTNPKIDCPEKEEQHIMDKEALKEKIIGQIKTVFDPEIPVNIWELGLIYSIESDVVGMVSIRMTLTTPHVPGRRFTSNGSTAKSDCSTGSD